MITKCTALQLAPKGIRVNAVSPGLVLSNILRGIGMEDPEMMKQTCEQLAVKMPLKLLATGGDIGYAVMFLANNNLARNITGTILVSDSGVSVDPGCMKATEEVLKH